MGAGASRDRLKMSVGRLLEEDVADPAENQEANDFWAELWKISTTPEEIFSLISPDDVRRLRNERRDNLKVLFTQAVGIICQLVTAPSSLYFEQALNAVRVLTRLMPFLLEVPNDPFVHELCWVRPPPPRPEGTEDATQGEEEEPYDPLAVLLLHACMHLCFLPNFSIDPSATHVVRTLASASGGGPLEDEDEEEEECVIWAPGVGASDDEVSRTTAHDKHRLEVLRLLLTCLCDPLFHKASSSSDASPSPGHHMCPASVNRWLSVATSADCPHAPSLFYSLLNTIVGFDPVGWGLPYGSMSMGTASQRYLDAAIQVLLVLLDYGPAAERETEGPTSPPTGTTTPGDNAETSDAPSGAPSPPLTTPSQPSSRVDSGNVYRQLLAKIHQPRELSFLFDGMVRLLNSVHMAQSAYLPGTVAQISLNQELLTLLWKLLEENRSFMPHILKAHDITQLVVPLCYLILDARRDASKVGLVHICTFILLKLSGERNFGVALNKPFDQRLPTDLPLFTGNHTDLLFIVLHKVVVNGSDKLSSLTHCFLTIMCNVSPYCKALCLVASVKVLNLFELFTSPRFLYAAESNHMYVSLLLELLNNLVQYQYDGNAHLVYAILRRKDVFVKLANLTLPLAIKAATETSRPASTSTRSPPLIRHTSSLSSDLTDAPVPTEGPTLVVGTPAQQTPQAPSSLPPPPSSSVVGAEATPPPSQPTDASPPTHPTGRPNAAGRFIPTEEWLSTVKAELPLTTIMRLLQYLVPQVDELCMRGQASGQGVDERAILTFLKSTTLVGLLPVPHPIVIRKYQANQYTSLWFTAFLWGVNFLRNQHLPLFDGGAIQLFTVTVASN